MCQTRKLTTFRVMLCNEYNTPTSKRGGYVVLYLTLDFCEVKLYFATAVL
jgi:hypothetical protein